MAGGRFHVGANASETDEGCAQGKDNRDSDLCAQWKAADAASESAQAAWAQFWVGLLTLLAAGAAAYYAGWAAIHTRQGVEVTRELGNRQLRPYILYDKGEIKVNSTEDHSRRFLEVDVSFRNCGVNPGIITAASKAIYAPSGEKGWGHEQSSWRPVRVVVGPNQIERVRFDAISADNDGNFSWFAMGILIWYEDFGNPSLTAKFQESFWLFFDGTGLRQDYPNMGFSLYRPQEGGE